MRFRAPKHVTTTVNIQNHTLWVQRIAANAQRFCTTQIEPIHRRSTRGVKEELGFKLKCLAQGLWTLCVRHMTLFDQL